MKNIKNALKVLLILAIVIVMASGCSKPAVSEGKVDEPKQETDSKPQDSEKVLKEKEVVIGISGAFSGSSAELSTNNVQGIEMAINECNENGGIIIGDERVKFRLETADDKGDPAVSINNARKFVDLYDAKIVFNNNTTSLLPMLEINEEEGGEFIVVGYTSNAKVTTSGNKLVVGMVPNNRSYHKGYAQMAIDQGYKTAGLFCNQGTYGEDWEAGFSEAFTELGGEIIIDSTADYWAGSDFSAQVTSIIDADPDCLLIGGPSVGTALVIEQLRSFGYDGALFVIDQAKLDEILYNLDNDMSLLKNYFGLASFSMIPFKSHVEFTEEFEKVYGRAPSNDMTYPFNAMKAMIKAMEISQTYSDAYAIREALEQALPFTEEDGLFSYINRGISVGGRFKTASAVVHVDKNGNYGDFTLNITWPKNEEEFEQEKAYYEEQLVESGQNVVLFYNPLPDNEL